MATEVTFTRKTSTINAATDRPTLAETTIVGHAVRTAGSPRTYESLRLRESEAPTLLFAPNAYTQETDTPRPGDTVSWQGSTWKVLDVAPLAPDGVTILAKIVIGR